MHFFILIISVFFKLNFPIKVLKYAVFCLRKLTNFLVNGLKKVKNFYSSLFLKQFDEDDVMTEDMVRLNETDISMLALLIAATA